MEFFNNIIDWSFGIIGEAVDIVADGPWWLVCVFAPIYIVAAVPLLIVLLIVGIFFRAIKGIAK